ncbi:class C sortase [Corynebacterium camporealensis]
MTMTMPGGEPNRRSGSGATAVKARHAKKEEMSLFRRVFLPVLLILVGLSVMLYPVVATQWNNHVQRQIADRYDELMREQQENDPEALIRAVEEAREYNAANKGGPILDPWLARVSKDNEAYQEYLDHLNGASAMSQVTIPSIDSKLPVYHGTDEETLQKGLGHLFGSALPVGGEGNHTVITGHTGLTNATLWDNLIDVKEGDAIYVSTFGEKMKYEVYDIDVVLPEETDSLGDQEGRDLLTLITCTPYGINTHRLLVHAERVPMDEEDLQALEDASGFKMQWWMWLVVAAAALVLLLLIWWIRRQAKKNKSEEDAAEANDEAAEAEAGAEIDEEN